jgi:hypothetical protein
LCSLFLFPSLFAQKLDTLSLHSSYTLTAKARQIYADHLGQFYLITQKNELIKYSPQGKELFRYSDLRYGRLTYVDVSNPMQLLLFYGDFNYLVQLERTLTGSGFLNLQELGYPIVSAVASAADGNIWLFDDFNSRLIKVDRRGKKLLESASIPLLLGRRPEINYLKESGEKIYALEEGKLQVFDLFGQWIREIRLPAKEMQFVNLHTDRILFGNGQKLTIQSLTDPMNLRERYLPPGLPEFRQIALTKEHFFILTSKEVKAYGYGK